MALSHPLYGDHVYVDPFRGVRRWSVAGTKVWIVVVGNAVEEGLSPEEIVAGHPRFPPHSLPHVAAVHRMHREYLVRVGRLAAA